MNQHPCTLIDAIQKSKIIFAAVGYEKHIAVNTRLLLPDRLEGIGYFAHEVLKTITAQHPEVKFTFLFDRPFSPSFIYSKNVEAVWLFPQARHPLLYIGWFEISVARWLRCHQPDLFLSPDGYGVLNTTTPQLLVMHDLAYAHYPQHMGKADAWYYRFFMPRFAAKASRIATVSEFSKQDIVKTLGVKENKVDVVYNGVKPHFKPLTEAGKTAVRKKLSTGRKYLVCVGSLNPRKNVVNVLRAFDACSKPDLKLVIAGARGWKTGEIFDVHNRMKRKEDVIFTGRLSEDELAKTIGAAEALVYPSLFEGFGVPPLEAMACGVPVIVSNVASLPEICGDAALYVRPEMVSDITSKINALLENEHLRQQLIAKGLAHHSRFSWQRSADLLWNSCEKVLQQRAS